MSTQAGEIAENLLGAMVAKEPIPPCGWATVRDQHGNPIYLVAYVLGPTNIDRTETLLTKVRDAMDPVSADLSKAISQQG